MRKSIEWPFPPGEECFVAWRDALSLLVDCSIPESADPTLFDFHGSTWQLPGVFLHVNGGSAITMVRTQQVIEERPNSHMALYMLTGGSVTADYDGLLQNHVPGDIVIVDYSSPYESRTSGYEGITLTFDKSSAPAGLQGDVHGLVLAAETDAGAILGAQLTALVNHIDGLSIDLSEVAVDGIMRFAAAAFAAPATREERDRRSLFQRASSIARQRLNDPDFGPDELAAALYISRSKLFRLFEAHDGVQRWMLAERLRASLQCIVQSKNQKISTVARKHGFRSEAHFSRAFQKRYQVSPSSVRTLAMGAEETMPYETLLKQDGRNRGAIIEAWLATTYA